MSVEAPKTVEETAPVESKPVEQSSEIPALATSTETPATDAVKTESTETPAAATSTTADETKPVEETLKKDETVVEAVPASEGLLGYKAPGLLKQFHFSKHFFYFSEEPLSSEALTSYVRSEKTGVAQNAAWARETGKGVLFHSKRSEDKAHPAGLIPLAEATNVTKQGALGFSFEVHGKSHKFEAANSGERDSWIVAIEKQVEESKAIKEEITSKESYKDNVKEFSKPAVAAAVATSRSKSKEPKKSLDAATATAAATETKPEETTATPAAPAATTLAPTEEKKKDTAKERSQSRKRTSIFGSLIGKKDEAKEEKKAEDKVEKEEKKEDKKAEAEIKKEEAKEEHNAPKAAEAAAATAGAAAVAAAPAAIVSDNKEEKKEETPVEATSPTEKKTKRGSVFGSLFNKKVTSPTTEKTEKEAGPALPAKDDVPPVSDTAPKLDEPIENKPIDAAAVTAPANTDGAVETPKETPAAETKTEKKSFLSGFINKKPEAKKEESKVTEPVALTEPTPAVEATPATTEATDAPKTEEVTKEERPTAEKRRTSLFGSLGTIKKKDESKTNEDGTERKREKSPLPSKIGGLFRKPSKAVKTEEPKAVETKDETKVDTPVEATPATTEPVASPTATTDVTDSKIVGDVVPENLQAQEKVATAPEVKATA